MALSENHFIIIAAALAATILTALFISIWQGVSSRRTLAECREQLRIREGALAEASAQQRGQAVALEQAQLQLQAKSSDLSALTGDLTQVQARLNASLQENTQLQTQQDEREDRHLEQIKLLNETRENLKKEFENLANKIFEDKGK
ncbi:MAG: DNA recombination protein RmuC, partial [Halioglobus sp.]|nr:DNA recombination protein RmuC [Halioglobus sp.]